MIDTQINMQFANLLKNGDESVFRSIYETYFNALCVYSNRLISDRQAASDIVHDAFVSLWKLKDKFDAEIKVRSFLYITVHNLSVNYLRANKMRLDKLALLSNVVFEADFSETLISTELENQMVKFIDNLPKECSKVMKLSLIGKSYKEIGEMLGIAISTVRNHRVRGVKILKEKFRLIS